MTDNNQQTQQISQRDIDLIRRWIENPRGFMQNLNTQEIPQEIPQPQPQPQEIPQPSLSQEQIRQLIQSGIRDEVFGSIYNLIKPYIFYMKSRIILIDKLELKNAKYVYLYENDSCAITQEPIKNYDYYYKCPNCNKPFKYQAFREWLLKNPSCPLCRHEYSNLPDLYMKRPKIECVMYYGSAIGMGVILGISCANIITRER